MKPRLESAFKQGLMDVAATTHAWLITGGLSRGSEGGSRPNYALKHDTGTLDELDLEPPEPSLQAPQPE